MRGKIATVLTLGAVLSSASVSEASTILGGTVVASGGEVRARYDFDGAAFSNELVFELNGQVIFDSTAAPGPTEVNLGTFEAGTELLFSLHVLNTGETYFTGPAERNPDGLAHAIVSDGAGTDLFPVFGAAIAPYLPAPGRTFVGFEDIFGGGDRDYEDLLFSFTNTAPSAVPEPGSLALLGVAAAAGLRARARRA